MKTVTEITLPAPADPLVLDAAEAATMCFAGALRSMLYWFHRRAEKPDYRQWVRDYLKTVRQLRAKLPRTSQAPLLRLEPWQVARDYYSGDFDAMSGRVLADRLSALQLLARLMPPEDPRHFDVRNQRDAHVNEAARRFIGLHVTPVDHLRAA